ncbi:MULTISPECIES: hypothetical protein [unclassified Microcoleus]|uniref:hypothetical protein n=1 Tax=unclassified Microcoleus TaxID=2642155 RepID=UPI002FD647F5
MMNDLLRESLCKIIEQDPSLNADAGRCRGTLSDDLRGKYPKEIQLIVEAINYGIPAKLLALKGKTLTQVQLDSFKQELQDKLYLEKAVAQWIIESWALALGVILNKEASSQTSGTPLPPTSTIRKKTLLGILGSVTALTLIAVIIGYAADRDRETPDRSVPQLTSTPPSSVSVPEPVGKPQPTKKPKPIETPAPPTSISVAPTTVPTPESTATKETPKPIETPTSPTPISVTPIPAPTTQPTKIKKTPEPTGVRPSISSPAVSPIPSPSPSRVVKLPPPLPTSDEINQAISKLQAMNPNEVLEFPVEEDPNYRVIGFRDKSGKYYGLSAKTVEDFLQDSLEGNGKFSEAERMTLIVRNQSTNQRLILKPISKNSPLGIFVRSLNTS